MADRLSEDIVSLLDENWAARYKCFCRCAHLRTASAIICAFDLVMLAIPCWKGIDVYRVVQSNPVAIGWFVASVLLLTCHVSAIVAAWVGLITNNSLCLIPKLVLKVFTIALLCVSGLGMAYLVWNSSPMLTNLLTSQHDMSTRRARSTVKLLGTGLCLAIAAFIAIQIWFLLVLYDSYRYVRSRQLEAEYSECMRQLHDGDTCTCAHNNNHTTTKVAASNGRTAAAANSVTFAADVPPQRNTTQTAAAAAPFTGSHLNSLV